MPNNKLTLTGKRFGRLIAQRDSGRRSGHNAVWECLCDCGATAYVSTANLGKGTLSCGCLRDEKIGNVNLKHGKSHTPEHRVWRQMIARCTNPNYHERHLYLDRGITVCARWLNDFAAFYADMGPRPTPDHTIERLDVNGNYEPSNCVWLHKSEQSKNRRPSSEWAFKAR